MRKSITIYDVLAQYPGPVTLSTPKSASVVPALLLALFCVYVFFQDGPQHKALGVVIGGFSLLFALVNYFRDSTIELSAWGFTTIDYGGDRVRCAWRAASEFNVSFERPPCVIYLDRNHEDDFFGPRRSVAVLGPFNILEMAALMNAWRDRALGIQ
jgi:hypothetical protein